MTDQELLQFAEEHDMVDLDKIQATYDMNKYLKTHTYSIWCGQNGRWYTYLPSNDGRKQISRATKEGIEQCVIDFWKEEQENPTLDTLFHEWIDRKITSKSIQLSTKTRYENDWKSYFGDFKQKKIRHIKSIDIEDFVIRTIIERNLSYKAFSGVRTLLYGIFRMAKKHGYIAYNIKDVIADIEFNKNTFYVKPKDDLKQVYTTSEEKVIVQYLKDHPDIVNLGLLLIFKSGLRIGELVTLKPGDITENVVHVCRTEAFYIEDGRMYRYVKESPKTEAGNRDIIIPDNWTWILKRLRINNPFGEWVFMHGGKRYTTDAFRKRIRTICKNLALDPKSPHKIRKTYGSILYDSDVPKSLMCSQMGHTDVSCLEKHYYYNRNTEDEKEKYINGIIGL